MPIPQTVLHYLVRNPLALLQHGLQNDFTEEEWKEIYEWFLDHRMTSELHCMWLRSQLTHGKYRFRAIGQMFARFATIGKGFSTVDHATKLKMKKSEFNNKNN